MGILAAVSLMAAALTSMPAYADAEKVVTLGADLSQEDQNRILKYFGVLGQDIRTIYVTNDEERALLSSWIPLSVIGTRTLSCAYVKPTNSGGIQVKTANLNWVTSNMIASALSTSGVKNCEVIAACPREVSGTGALTGVLKAYEYASSAVLDPQKKEVAAQEIATVSNIADVVGQTEATQLINDIKIQIIEQQVPATDLDTIQEIVDAAVANVESEMQMKIDEATDIMEGMSVRESLDSLAANIAAQEYDYEEVRETLERVEKNISELKASEPASVNVNVNIDNQAYGGSANAEGGSSNAEGGSANAAGGNASSDAQGGNAAADAAGGDSSAAVGSEEPELAEDSILLNTDDSALGEDVVMSATTEEAVPFVPEAAQAPQAADEENNDLFEIVTTDEGTFEGDASGGESAAIDETGNEGPTATEEAPSSEGLFEDQPAADETPAAEDQPAADETPAAEDQPAADEMPVTEDQPAAETPVTEDQPADEVPVSEDVFEDQPADEVPVSEDLFEDQPADEVPVSEDVFEDQPADEYVPEEEAAADETYDEFAVDEYEEETYNEDISGDEELTGDPDENADGDIFADEPDEPVADEGADEPESESAPAPLLSVGSEGDKSVDGFSLSLFAEGDVVPVSGKVTITDADGAEVAVIDLSDPDSFGVVPAEGSAVSGDFAGGDATEIHVLTSGAGLGEGTYTVKATDVVFADNDGSGSAEAGTERPAAEASGKLTYTGSAAEPLQSGKSSYTAPGEADFQLYAPEGTSSVDAVSSDEGVASVLAYDEETQVLTVDLLNTGDAQINVTYYDEEGGILGEDSIPLAVF
jgi:uncharacterized protein YpuA (DUF1002 family)